MDEEQALKILKELNYENNDTTSYIWCRPSPNGTRRVGIGINGFTVRDLGKQTMFMSGVWHKTTEKDFRSYVNPSTRLESYDE